MPRFMELADLLPESASCRELWGSCQFPLTRRWLDFHDVELRFAEGSLAVLDRHAGSG